MRRSKRKRVFFLFAILCSSPLLTYCYYLRRSEKKVNFLFSPFLNGSRLLELLHVRFGKWFLFVAAGAGEVVNGFGNITNMQEMTADICKNAKINDTVRLRDARDNKYYWIAKLADENCWMTQNLAYDGGGTKEDSINFPDDNTARYYNPGQWVYSTPTSTNNCDSTSTGLDACINNGWVNVNGWEAVDDVNYAKIVDITSKTYDAHYLVGNYYSWIAATAGSGNASVTTAGANVDSSICPKGWKLPTSGSGGEFQNAFNGLSVATITTIPYYFVYGGYVNGSSLGLAGDQGFYWSSTANDSNYAYYLYFYTNVDPSNLNYRYLGFSVRCVAR